MGFLDEDGNYVSQFTEEELKEQEVKEELKEEEITSDSDEKKEDLDEAVNVKSIIDEVIDTNWSKDNESQMKVLQLMKGIATSDEKVANDFMKKIDNFTSSLKKEDFKEGSSMIKKGKVVTVDELGEFLGLEAGEVDGSMLKKNKSWDNGKKNVEFEIKSDKGNPYEWKIKIVDVYNI